MKKMVVSRFMINYKSKRFVDRLKWVIIDETGKVVNNNPSEDELKGLKTEPRTFRDTNGRYNSTNTCEYVDVDNKRCTEKLYPGNVRRERDGEGNETGRWLCINCYGKYDSNSSNNIRKSLRDRRTGSLKDSKHIFGDNTLELACILYGWEDLNKKLDNYKIPIDCYDPKTGLYHQVQGRHYNSRYGQWSFSGFEREMKKKKYETMICFCISKDGKTVERIYKFPWKEIMEIKSVAIVKNSSRTPGWYEKYRETNEDELKRSNDIWKEIVKEKCL